MQENVTKRIERVVDSMLDWSQEKRLDWIRKLLQACDYEHERYVITMLYIYGLRPIELMMMSRERFSIADGLLTARLPTAKRGVRRIIELNIGATPFMPILARYVVENDPLLPMRWNHTTNINAIFAKIAKRLEMTRLSPYVFRKYRLSFLAIEADASAIELQTWKGASDMRSVSPYLRMKPIRKFRTLVR